MGAVSAGAGALQQLVRAEFQQGWLLEYAQCGWNARRRYPTCVVCHYLRVFVGSPDGASCAFRFHVSNMEPSGSRVTNSGLSKEKTLLKGDGHQRRLWSVQPQLQQRPWYWAQAWRRASSVRSGVHKDKLVIKSF